MGAAGGGAVETGGEQLDLLCIERQLVLADLHELAGGTQPRQRGGGWRTRGEDEVGVRRQLAHDVAEQARRRGFPAEAVHVVEDEAHVERRVAAQRGEDGDDRLTLCLVTVECGDDRRGQVAGPLVTMFASEPRVHPNRGRGIRPHRLGERGRLPEPGAGDDHRDGSRPPLRQSTDERRPGQLVGQRWGCTPEGTRYG